MSSFVTIAGFDLELDHLGRVKTPTLFAGEPPHTVYFYERATHGHTNCEDHQACITVPVDELAIGELKWPKSYLGSVVHLRVSYWRPGPPDLIWSKVQLLH